MSLLGLDLEFVLSWICLVESQCFSQFSLDRGLKIVLTMEPLLLVPTKTEQTVYMYTFGQISKKIRTHRKGSHNRKQRTHKWRPL